MTVKDEVRKTEHVPGEGIKSLKTSTIFRLANFELYAKPNKIVMGIGVISMGICIGYIAYMRAKYEGMGYYTAVDKEGSEVFVKKKSKWDI